jgi:hypothetical protein
MTFLLAPPLACERLQLQLPRGRAATIGSMPLDERDRRVGLTSYIIQRVVLGMGSRASVSASSAMMAVMAS